MSRLSGRIRIFGRAIPRLVLKPLRRRPASVQRILLAHHLLLGDTLLLTPLLAKLRAQYPQAQIALACPKAIVPLYAGRPFDVTALPFDPRDLASVKGVLDSGPYDLGLVLGDNRHSWLALGAGCRWIVAHAGDVPAWKNWPVNQSVPYPAAPAAWADLATELIEGAPPRAYRPGDWPAPAHAALPDADLLTQPYVVLHPGASTAVKRWPDGRWRELAQRVEALGYVPVWSGGPGEAELIRAIDPDPHHPNLAGRLGLGELWHLFAGARAVVCPDTGVAHLGRLIGVPTVALFGPGNAQIHGAGRYWSEVPFVPVTIAEMPCRDQPFIFRREVAWVRRCDRNSTTCVAWKGDHADCMGRISVDSVYNALQNVLVEV
ncbi:glycosyltransferase family 9 protein [Paraburkholderia phenazinium]|jgi:ADP-heptose:LPS heptosyltransferase|uniref:ADP-heptose:LPS heptosyltransferase n=1 Tax=Paraburkholderia phenazinium TaxID=60549 RepID=A0A1G8FCY3_9BURK|nr:glycosyltransferase family 9 protein [Paraburkholderia phenazinium]SDH80034.1 ADP-heptose:LPS heptosyltransferase [Paraburkholderia phenazinium]